MQSWAGPDVDYQKKKKKAEMRGFYSGFSDLVGPGEGYFSARQCLRYPIGNYRIYSSNRLTNI